MVETPREMPRRRFVEWFLGGSLAALGASVLYPLLRFLDPPRIAEQSVQQLEVGPANDPDLVQKGFKIVRFGNEPVIVLRAAEGDYRAYTATCTHLDCIVEFRPEVGRIWCNCHNGQYDPLTGRNVAGPPPRPLTPLVVHAVEQNGGTPLLVVSRA
jgi:cytochrome b6-f complex iron-sulfur subunit